MLSWNKHKTVAVVTLCCLMIPRRLVGSLSLLLSFIAYKLKRHNCKHRINSMCEHMGKSLVLWPTSLDHYCIWIALNNTPTESKPKVDIVINRMIGLLTRWNTQNIKKSINHWVHARLFVVVYYAMKQAGEPTIYSRIHHTGLWIPHANVKCHYSPSNEFRMNRFSFEVDTRREEAWVVTCLHKST